MEEHFDEYYMGKVYTKEGARYIFSYRLLVHDIDIAKKYDTIRSLKRCLKMGGFTDYEILNFKRKDRWYDYNLPDYDDDFDKYPTNN